MCVCVYVQFVPLHGCVHVSVCESILFPRFFTYGDLPLTGHLQQISEHVLNQFDRSTPSLSVPMETKWAEPVSPQLN